MTSLPRTILVASCPFVALLLVGCGGSDSTSSTGAYPGAELGLAPVEPGFVRYVTRPVTIESGQDIMWNEWMTAPLEEDMDVVAVAGTQSPGGHHAILYGTTDLQPVGITREWHDSDQLTTRTLGSVGTEGDGGSALPPGVVYRVKKGSALMIQSHFLNATGKPLEGVSAIDVQLVPADPNAKLAGLFVNTSFDISVAPNAETTKQVTCKVPRDLNLIAYANHMHSFGVSITTELTRPDGTTKVLKADPVWDYAWAFAPIFARFPLDAPEVIPAGSTLKTRCTWLNTGGDELRFPTEMCVFVGTFVGESDVTCLDGASL